MSLCVDCDTVYEKAWFVDKREGLLQRLIGVYKFERAMSAYGDLGDLLMGILPDLPKNTVIVPIPTVASHIRERGYDHMLLIAQYVALRRGLVCNSLLSRKNTTKQRQSDAATREVQAREAFVLRSDVIDPDIPYLIIDDVVTTGATIKHAARILKKAGAKHIWVAFIARQM
jgi:ComF family protein